VSAERITVVRASTERMTERDARRRIAELKTFAEPMIEWSGPITIDDATPNAVPASLPVDTVPLIKRFSGAGGAPTLNCTPNPGRRQKSGIAAPDEDVQRCWRLLCSRCACSRSPVTTIPERLSAAIIRITEVGGRTVTRRTGTSRTVRRTGAVEGWWRTLTSDDLPGSWVAMASF
jgi:hypothetical protein